MNKRCPGKRRYDRVGALLAVGALDRKNRRLNRPEEEVRAYFCGACKAWHVTSKPYRKDAATS